MVNPGANLTSVSVNVTPYNPYTVFPMARAVNVWNPTTGAVDGSSIAVETGGAFSRFQTGDTIEQEHHYAMVFQGMLEHNFEYQTGGGIDSTWTSVVGGGFGSNNYGAWLMNTNQPTLYANYPAGATPWVAGQGMMGTPYGYTLSGSWRNGFWMKMPPYSTTSLTGALVVGCFDMTNNTNVCAKWTQPYNMLLAENANSGGYGEDVLQYSIPTTTWSLTAGATSFNGSSPYCTETLAGNASGGFSVSCNGKTSKLDTSGNLSLPGAVRAQGGVTGATINGEFTVDGTTYTTLNAAWAAALSQANTSGQNQTIRLGPGHVSGDGDAGGTGERRVREPDRQRGSDGDGGQRERVDGGHGALQPERGSLQPAEHGGQPGAELHVQEPADPGEQEREPRRLICSGSAACMSTM